MIILSNDTTDRFLKTRCDLNCLIYYARDISRKKTTAIIFVASTTPNSCIIPERSPLNSATTAIMVLLSLHAVSLTIAIVGFVQSFSYTLGNYLMITLLSTLVSLAALFALIPYWRKALANGIIPRGLPANGTIKIYDLRHQIKSQCTCQQKESVAIYLNCVTCILFFRINISILHNVIRPNILKNIYKDINATHILQIFTTAIA